MTGLRVDATSRALVPPLTFGPYTLVERIGIGAHSEVFRAHRQPRRGFQGEGPAVALKRVLAGAAHDPQTQATLAAEAELLKSLRHDGVVRVLDDGVVSGVAYVVYELVDGADVEKIITRARQLNKRLPLEFAFAVAVQLFEALAYVHEALPSSPGNGSAPAIVHRDVCPSNILVSWDGRVRLADFEIAKVPGRNTTTGVGEIKGTIRYMSPEQVKGESLDPRSDIYSAGAVILELFGGKPLFAEFKPIEILRRLAAGEQVWNPELNPVDFDEIQAVLRKVLARERGERYDTSAQVLRALLGAAEKLSVSIGPAAIAHTMGELFPKRFEQGTEVEESRIMADEKGGSDLDVFEGLAKKSGRPSNLPGAAPPSMPSPKSTATPPIPPPASLRAATTLVGVPAPVPPPTSGALVPGLPPPSMKPSSPTGKSGATALGLAPSPAGADAPKATPPPPPPPPPKPLSEAPISKAPNTLLAAVPPPPAPPVSIGSALGLPAEKGSDKSAEKEEKTPPKGTAKSKNIDMDWEDDEESTHVFENQKHGMGKPSKKAPPPSTDLPPVSKVGAAAALLASSGGAAAVRPSAIPKAPPASVVPPPPPAPPPTRASEAPAPVAAAAAPSRRDEAPVSRRREGSSGKVALVLAGLAMVAAVALGVYIFVPRTGELLIDIKSKSGAAIPTAAVYVDGVKVCENTPCRVNKVDGGQRAIKVVVGDAVVQEVANVEPGKERSVFLTLDDGAKEKPVAVATQTAVASVPPPAESGGTGFSLVAPTGVKLIVDGKERGVSDGKPFTLKDLPAGDHKIKLEGGELYESVEKTVAVTQGSITDLGAQKPKVLKGKLSLELKTEGAVVTLSGKQDGKTFQKDFNEKNWEKQPLVLKNLDPKGELKITAKKKGFADFTETVVFPDGEAERSISIELVSADKPVAVPSGTVPPTNTGTAPTNTATATTAPPPAGNATLSMNSIPISKVVLNGRPLGNTPQSAQVPPGSHTVMFIHPEKGRKSVTVTVKAGEKKGASVKF
jgi:serine/threonine-protein kinase